ncbi:Exosome complex exonuclease RRP42, partial [Temnothorax longispinosus]
NRRYIEKVGFCEMAETSLGEKTFIIHGVDLDLRNDGRSRYQYRSIEIETRLMKLAHGSARLRIGNITDVLVGVKLELIDTPYAVCRKTFSSANATPAFEGKGRDDLATEISNVLSMAYQTPDAFDLKQLCIIPHKKC